MPKRPKKLQEFSNYEREKESKRRAAEELEKIELMGQSSDIKAAKWVKEEFKEREKEESKQLEEGYLSLEKLRKGPKLKYNVFLGRLFFRHLNDESIPAKYQVYADADEKGIVVGIKGTSFYKAVKPSGIEKYDLFAMKVLAIQVGNTIARMEGYFKQTDGGVAIADDWDAKQLTRRNKRQR